MKIPETSANVGAYYGNEENGQWQPQMIDTGVGGGGYGSGDAGMRRAPACPAHLPRHPPAGYVMAGPYYGPPYAVAAPQPDDFADYMWMENEEEFDKQVLQQLEEEALMEQCIEAMLEDEQRERRANRENRHDYPTTSNGNPSVSLEEAVSRSTLNPLAAEFVPTRVRQPPPSTEESKETQPAQTEVPSTEHSRIEADSTEQTESRAEVSEETKTEEAATPPKDPPEVSAADIHPTSKHNKTSKKPADTKKPARTETKKKPVVVKSETKVQPKKKEVKTVKSDVKVEEKTEEIVEAPKPQTPTTEEVPSAPGIKPINYAAAAKASKPKLKSASPPIEKPAPPKAEKPKPEPAKDKPKTEKTERKSQPKDKPVSKEKVNVQRKNSAK